MKRMPECHASRNSLFFPCSSLCGTTVWRENNYWWGGRKKKKKSPFRIPLHQRSQFLLQCLNNNTSVGLCVTFHDSIKNRWINNKLNGRRLVDLHAPASSSSSTSSLTQKTLPIPCSDALFIRFWNARAVGKPSDDGKCARPKWNHNGPRKSGSFCQNVPI